MNLVTVGALLVRIWKVVNNARKSGIAAGVAFAAVEFKTDLVSIAAPILADPELNAILTANGLPTEPSTVVAALAAMATGGAVYVIRNTPLGNRRKSDAGSGTEAPSPNPPPPVPRTKPKRDR